MPNSKKTSPRKKVFVDYKPAELKTNQDWLIVYYVKVPGKDELKHFIFSKFILGTQLKNN